MITADDIAATRGTPPSRAARNLLYFELERLRAGQTTIASRLEEMHGAAQSGALVDAIKSLGGAIAGIAMVQGDQLEITKRIASTAEQQAATLALEIRPESNSPIAFLTLGVDIDGTFNQRSRVGRFLMSAVGVKRPEPETGHNGQYGTPYRDEDATWAGLWQLSAPPVKSPASTKLKPVRRPAFISACTASAADPQFGIPATIGEEDFGRFYDMAPYLLLMIEQAGGDPI
jgi:hypothetical protein